jgi:pyruvate,water dikinase
MMGYLIGFEDENALNANVVGQKFRSLAQAYRAGFAVPQAVAISTAAHQYYLENNRWPDGLAGDVSTAALALKISHGLSIRSSATREDLEKQSFAGQYRSFLQVVNPEELKINIEACWQSISSESVRSYLEARHRFDEAADTPLMAVIIQKMVAARASGIAFGRNPMKPTRKEIVIEAVKGLGEDLVSGHRTPCRAVVDETGRVNIIAPDSTGGATNETDHLLQLDPFWRRIARLVEDLESRNGKKPLDIEWAVDEDRKIWLLQSRLITTLEKPANRIPDGLWTRKIATDLWADRLTPFMADHMLRNAPRFDLSRALRILGLPVIRPTLSVIEGYLYLNGESIMKGISYIPPKLRLPELDSLFPASIDLSQLAGPSISTFFSVSLRSLLLPILEPGSNPIFCLWLARRDLKSISRRIDGVSELPDTSPRMAMNKILAVLEILTRLQIKNQWPYFYATLFTWVLRWLAVNRLNLSNAEFLTMLSEGANNISIEIEHEFRKMAKEIIQHRDLAELFLHYSVEQIEKEAPPAIQDELKDFLSRFGCRSRHRTLFIKRWSESPQEVIGILRSLVQSRLDPLEHPQGRTLPMPKRSSSKPAKSPNKGNASSVTRNLPSAGAGGWTIDRLCLPLAARLTRLFLDMREELRFTLDRILFLLRQTLLILGEQTGLGNKIMFLKKVELEDMVEGKLIYSQARRKANFRYDQFVKPFEWAAYYHEGRAENEFQIEGTAIRGIGTSPGRVSGRARIVDDPTSVDIKKGDILVAKNTDPGWTPILSIVGGLVMEEGGLLNHCSIVARELGVPSIVGVQGATRRIHEYDQITIDGGMGVITIEE